MAPYGILIWAVITAVLASILILASHVHNARRNRTTSVAFFHPYTNDGGGGERVLWCAVKAIQEESPDLDCIVYTGDHDASPDSLLARAVDRFGVELLHPPKVPSFLSFDCLFLVFVLLGFAFKGFIFVNWFLRSIFANLALWWWDGKLIHPNDGLYCMYYWWRWYIHYVKWPIWLPDAPRVILVTCWGYSDISWWENECRKDSNPLL